MDYAGKVSERYGHTTTGSHRQEPPSKGDVFVKREQRTSDGAARAEAKPTTNREQYQACLNIAEVRRRKTKSAVWIMPSRDRARRSQACLNIAES